MDDNSTIGEATDNSLTLLCDPNADDGANATFVRVIQCMDTAKKSIEIHMFVWRNDAIGNEIGKAVLRAAKRGVRIKIKKDRGAIMYERIEMNRPSQRQPGMGRTYPHEILSVRRKNSNRRQHQH